MIAGCRVMLKVKVHGAHCGPQRLHRIVGHRIGQRRAGRHGRAQHADRSVDAAAPSRAPPPRAAPRRPGTRSRSCRPGRAATSRMPGSSSPRRSSGVIATSRRQRRTPHAREQHPRVGQLRVGFVHHGAGIGEQCRRAFHRGDAIVVDRRIEAGTAQHADASARQPRPRSRRASRAHHPAWQNGSRRS